MPRILLVDDSASARHILAARLRERGYEVHVASDAAAAADMALSTPPHAVVTDLWMPGISGLQLCRLLRADPSTSRIPVVLLTASDDRRSRFWANCAGATAYVTKVEFDKLAEILAEATRTLDTLPPPPPTREGAPKVHERLSQLLDSALYDATVAGQVRALSQSAESVDGLFIELLKLASDLISYRWLALAPRAGPLLVHSHVKCAAVAEREARAALDAPTFPVIATGDDRALDIAGGPTPLVFPIRFGSMTLGSIALGPHPRGIGAEDKRLMELLATELGGPLRMAALIGEARHLAHTDTLTGLMNRRAFLQAFERERARIERHGMPLAVLMLDVDHFKKVNDTHGHDGGDAVLRGIAAVLNKIARKSDIVARWGGEEFVIALPQTAEAGSRVAAERVRRAIADATYTLPNGTLLKASASIGLASAQASFVIDELLGRADRALYQAKGRGRNRVEIG